jgi:hypothetical protein
MHPCHALDSSTSELVAPSLYRLTYPGYQSHRIYTESMCTPLKYDEYSFLFLLNDGILLSL